MPRACDRALLLPARRDMLARPCLKRAEVSNFFATPPPGPATPGSPADGTGDLKLLKPSAMLDILPAAAIPPPLTPPELKLLNWELPSASESLGGSAEATGSCVAAEALVSASTGIFSSSRFEDFFSPEPSPMALFLAANSSSEDLVLATRPEDGRL